MARYVLCMPFGPTISTGPNGAMGQLVPSAHVARYVLFMLIVHFMPIGPIGSTGQLVRYISMNYCQLGKLVPLALLARYVQRMQIGRIGSTGPIGAICLNELLPIGPIGSIGPIGAICPIVANWANRFHGPNWRVMYYVCQMGQLVQGPNR